VPDQFELAFPCAHAGGGEEQLFVSSRSPERVPALFVYGGEAQVVMPEDRAEPGGPHINTSVEVPSDADCAVTVRFDRESSTVSPDAANQVAAIAVPSDAFDVTACTGRQLPQVTFVPRPAPLRPAWCETRYSKSSRSVGFSHPQQSNGAHVDGCASSRIAPSGGGMTADYHVLGRW
jgi:hypothetical protein